MYAQPRMEFVKLAKQITGEEQSKRRRDTDAQQPFCIRAALAQFGFGKIDIRQDRARVAKETLTIIRHFHMPGGALE
ncbi:hypothetical protein SAMN05518866_107107 [Sphingobium sp. YR768]|nr:hypothetical protein SAMN05518866_107107 [Sphingobium sp. YR768]